MAQLTIQQAFDLALQHHQAGRLGEAEQIYRQILAQQPEHADAMHNLGMISFQMGRNDVAVELLRRAIVLNPSYAPAHNNLGNVLKGQGQFDEAIAAYRQAIALNPNLPEVHSNLGNALKNKGQLDEAIAAYRQAIALNPNLSEAHNNLGVTLKEKGQLDEAIAALRQAIALNPNLSEANTNLGIALQDKGQLDEAIAAHRRVIAGNPTLPEARYNLGNALQDKRQLDEAIAAYRQAIALRPNYAEAHSNLGNALRDKGQLDEAIAAHRRAIALNPSLAEGHSNLGIALKDKGQLDEAMAAFRQAISVRPNYAEAHVNLSLSLLTSGYFQQGWEEHEWRWKCREFPSPRRHFAQGQWDGSPLEDRTLLLHAEQGVGDAIQFIRYLPLVAQRGGKIIIECHTALQRLFRTVAANCQVVVPSQSLPAFDLHCPLLSLPRVFGTNLGNIPNTVPYLRADAEDARRWQDRLAGHSSIVKVGLGWAGNPAHKNDRNRSMKLARLAPLGQAPGVRFFSLQKGAAATEAKTPPAGMELVDWTQELKDFADTAALIANLDLVIAVDTAVAHLAGAMGKPVWTLLPYAADWRWMLERRDSPWYPTMRLFRQPYGGDWDSVIARVVEALRIGGTRAPT
jgi:tetratricopeptide (TPR) repeat protein